MIRWSAGDVAAVLTAKRPAGLVDLWSAIPPGMTTSAAALEAARRSAQIAIAQSLPMLSQQVAAAAGLSVGFRPEIFQAIAELPGFDTLAATAELALTNKLDLASLTAAARDLLIEIVADVTSLANLDAAMVAAVDGVGTVVQFVWQWVSTIWQIEKDWAAYEKSLADAALDCLVPGYSATLDEAEVDRALGLMASSPIWQDLFLPEVRPYDPDFDIAAWEGSGVPESGLLDDGYRGFTCCPAADKTRVIAPVGAGLGNRVQMALWPITYGENLGFGLLPMCPKLPCHRAIITPYGGQPYDSARGLPQLAGLGDRVWRLLWGRGPAAFAVDGRSIGSAWVEYLETMRRFIAPNAIGIGGQPAYDRKVCDDWSLKGRQRPLKFFFEAIGAPKNAISPDGIVDWTASAPYAAWDAFAEYQAAMLDRVAVFYVDASTCAPQWRERVADAQRLALDHPDAVCQLDDWQSIPDPELRAAVDQRRKSKGAQCFAAAASRVAAYAKVSATEGPSTAPLSEDAPDLPPMPQPSPPPRVAGESPARAAGPVIALVGLGLLAAWGLSQ